MDLRSAPRHSEHPISAFTLRYAKRLLSAGFNGYTEKPIRYKEFLASVAALLERGSNRR